MMATIILAVGYTWAAFYFWPGAPFFLDPVILIPAGALGLLAYFKLVPAITGASLNDLVSKTRRAFTSRLALIILLVCVCVVAVLGVLDLSRLCQSHGIDTLLSARSYLAASPTSPSDALVKAELDSGAVHMAHRDLFLAYLSTVGRRQGRTALITEDESLLIAATRDGEPIVLRVLGHLGLASWGVDRSYSKDQTMSNLDKARRIAGRVSWNLPELKRYALQEELEILLEWAHRMGKDIDAGVITEAHAVAEEWRRLAQRADSRMEQDDPRRGAEALQIRDLLGVLEFHAERFDRAIEEFEAVVRDADQNNDIHQQLAGDALNNKGIAQMHLGQYDEAIASLSRSAAIGYGDTERTAYSLLWAHAKAGHASDELEDLAQHLAGTASNAAQWTLIALSVSNDELQARALSNAAGRTVSGRHELNPAEIDTLINAWRDTFPGLPVTKEDFVAPLPPR